MSNSSETFTTRGMRSEAFGRDVVEYYPSMFLEQHYAIFWIPSRRKRVDKPGAFIGTVRVNWKGLWVAKAWSNIFLSEAKSRRRATFGLIKLLEDYDRARRRERQKEERRKKR